MNTATPETTVTDWEVVARLLAEVQELNERARRLGYTDLDELINA